MIRRPPRSTPLYSSAASDVYKRQVTDPGSPLHKTAELAGYRAVFLADPHVGGRYSVLGAFGLVPSALAGVPVAEILDEADAVSDSLAEDHAANPAIVLGAAMAGSPRRTLVFSN